MSGIDLVAELKTVHAAKREKVFAEYREVISRAAVDKATDGDRAAIASLVDALGLTPDQVAADVAAVAQYWEMRSQTDGLKALQQALNAAATKSQEFQARRDKIIKELHDEGYALDVEAQRLFLKHDELLNVQHRLTAHAAKHWRLLGLPDPVEEAKKAHLVGEAFASAGDATYSVISLESVMNGAFWVMRPSGNVEWVLEGKNWQKLEGQSAKEFTRLVGLLPGIRDAQREKRKCVYLVAEAPADTSGPRALMYTPAMLADLLHDKKWTVEDDVHVVPAPGQKTAAISELLDEVETILAKLQKRERRTPKRNAEDFEPGSTGAAGGIPGGPITRN